MKKIFLAPRSNETSYKNYISSMQGRPKEDIWGYLSDAERRLFGDQEKFFIWGCQPSMEGRWQKMALGDYVMFYTRGKFVSVGELQFKKKSEGLARNLWPVSKSTQKPWSCVFFVKNLTTISLPIADFSELTGYKMDRVQSFMRVSTGFDGILKMYGSTDNFVQSLKSGLDRAQISELSAIVDKSPSKLNSEDKARLDELTRGKSEEELEKALKNYAENALEKTPEQVTKQVVTFKRNRQLVDDMKSKYQNKCQICDFTFRTASGKYYSEAAHIIPISTASKGVDSPDNIWILCANHHRMLDTGAIKALSNYEYEENGAKKSLLTR